MKNIFNKSAAISLMAVKLFFLFCITSMGSFGASAQENTLKIPCHQVSESNEENVKSCDTCEQALNALDQQLIETEESLLKEVVLPKDLLELSCLSKERFIISYASNYYRPPPEVVLANAFYHPKKTTVLII